MAPLSAGLRLPAVLWDQMLAEVERRIPEEACGLVAGTDGRAQRVIPVENELHSAVRYRMESRAQVTALLEIEAAGLELAAIYHSHPGGPAYPSPTDIAEAFYPEAVYLIWSPAADGWQCRGFRIEAGQTQEIPVCLDDE